MPGVEAAIASRDRTGKVSRVVSPMAEGELALKVGWPSMMRGYLNEEERYRKCFAGPWYLTGDLAKQDADGYFWFVGRADDVIKSSGHLIGPFEVESALMEHPAVAEAAVIAIPHPRWQERPFLVVLPRAEVTAEELRALLAEQVPKWWLPDAIAFVDDLPHGPTGKLAKNVLRDWLAQGRITP